MAIHVDGSDVDHVFIDGIEQDLLFVDGVEVFRRPGLVLPRIDSIGAAPPYAFRDAVIPAPLQFTVLPLIGGETITCHRGDGSNVVAVSPGVFHISPVPTTDEDFLFTATNQAGESITRRYHWRRVTVPSWRGPTARRISQAPGVGTVSEVWELTAELFGHPQPNLSLTGDSYFTRAFARTNLNAHLSGTTQPYTFTLRVSFTRSAGHAWRQQATIRATEPLSRRTADAVFTIDIPGA